MLENESKLFPWNRSDISALLLIFILSLGLRLIHLFDLDVWFDEVVLLFQVKKSYLDIWNFCKTDNFPPLFPWLLKFWNGLLPGEHSLRLLCAILGSLTPPAAYLLGKEIQNRRLGLLLGLACCVSPPLIYYSQMIRMYCLLTLWGALSLLVFYRGLRTNEWKYWILMCIANILGFYTFVTFIILIFVEYIVLVCSFWKNIKRLLRPLVVLLPTLLLISFWAVPLLTRYHQIQGKFWLEEVSKSDWVKLWLFLGTGTDFSNRYTLAFLLNLSFLFGLLAGWKNWLKSAQLRTGVIIFILTLSLMYVLSKFGQPIFFKRYLIFILPLYLAIVISGAMNVSNTRLRILLSGLICSSLLITLGYYYFYYIEYHTEWMFSLPNTSGEVGDGHAISKCTAWLDENVKDNEVIIHYSAPSQRCFSFFPAIYYDKKSLPTYIFSNKEIPQHYGQQYLKPGQWIRSLSDLPTQPEGIWVVSLSDVESLFDDETNAHYSKGWRWVIEDNLPAQMNQLGYKQDATVHISRMLILHFSRQKANQRQSGLLIQ